MTSILNLNDVPPPRKTTEADETGRPVSGAPSPASRPSPSPAAPEPRTDSSFDTSALTGSPPSEPAPEVEGDPVKTLELQSKIVEQLATVYDPEIPVNIYELGLIYDITVDTNGLAVIKMTLTAPGCPAAVTLPAEVQGKVKAVEGVSDVRVDLVWDPPWGKERMSDAAKLQLGIFD